MASQQEIQAEFAQFAVRFGSSLMSIPIVVSGGTAAPLAASSTESAVRTCPYGAKHEAASWPTTLRSRDGWYHLKPQRVKMPPLVGGFGTGAVIPRAGTVLCGCARWVDVLVGDCPNSCRHRGEAVADNNRTVPDDVPVGKRHGGTCGQADRPICSLIIRTRSFPSGRCDSRGNGLPISWPSRLVEKGGLAPDPTDANTAQDSSGEVPVPLFQQAFSPRHGCPRQIAPCAKAQT